MPCVFSLYWSVQLLFPETSDSLHKLKFMLVIYLLGLKFRPGKTNWTKSTNRKITNACVWCQFSDVCLFNWLTVVGAKQETNLKKYLGQDVTWLSDICDEFEIMTQKTLPVQTCTRNNYFTTWRHRRFNTTLICVTCRWKTTSSSMFHYFPEPTGNRFDSDWE